VSRTSHPSLCRPLVTMSAAVALALLVGGCGVFSADEPEAAPAPSLSPSPLASPTEIVNDPTESLADFYDQQVEWKPCRTDKFCARITVPLDYENPDDGSIELSLLKVPARGTKQSVGSLLVNPGGPGASGVDYAARAETYFGAELRQAFDIVGFDPRGVGESTPLQCVGDDRLDAFVASDPDPDTPAEIREMDAMLAELGQGCLDQSGDLTAHMSTAEAAQDMDIIRAALGQKRLSYFGASYGTFLGATYAELFPKRVGRMVFDGAIDPQVGPQEMNLAQARGFERALRSYVGNCVDRADCFLGDSVDAGTQRIRTFLDDVEQQPIGTSGARDLAIGNAVLGIWAPLYNEDYWFFLDQALQEGFRGDGTKLMALSDAYTSRGPTGYQDNSLEALYAVNCLDRADGISSAKAAERVPRFEKVAPTFGAIFAFGLASCSTWPVEGNVGPTVLDAEGAAPILVIGTTRDPATPFEWAEALADQLESGVLVARDGDGHTGYGAGNPCVDRVVESYLVSGKVPKSDVRC
jgi:pimeloyl-ACP methyl ester carboxylesterase